MDSCDNQGQRAYSDGNDLNYIQVSVFMPFCNIFKPFPSSENLTTICVCAAFSCDGFFMPFFGR